MYWKQLSNFFKPEGEKTMDTEGYDSYCIDDDYLIQVKADRDDKWYTVTYLQVIRDDNDPDDYFFVIQLEGLPEDLTNIRMGTSVDNTNIPVKIFKRIHHVW